MLSGFTIKTRLILLPIPLLLPILALFISLFSEQNKSIRFSEKELSGIISLRKTYHIFETLIWKSKRSPNMQENDKIDLLLEEENIRKLTNDLENIDKSPTNALSLLENLRILQSKIGDDSNLILDPDIDTYYLMDICLIRFPSIYESLAKIRLEGNDPSNKADLKAELFSIHKEIKEVRKSIGKIKEFNPAFFEEDFQKSESLITKIEEKVSKMEARISDPKEISIPAWNGTEEEEFSELLTLSLDQLEKLIQIRVASFRSSQKLSALAIFIILFAAVSFLVLILKSILSPLSLIVKKIEELTSEDANLSHELPNLGQNELGILSESINKFLSNLTDIILKLKSASLNANTSSHRLKKDARLVSESANNLASTSEESSSALEELSRSFDLMLISIVSETKNISEIETAMRSIKSFLDSVSGSLASLENISSESNRVAEEGDKTVKYTENSMNEIKEVTSQISGIVKLITDISEQTNLLALNASIEAARAGDAGKGFSVVADEISKLANKTRSSVNGIKALIEKTNSAVNTGSDHVTETVTTLSHIVDKSQAIRTKVSQLQKEMSLQSQSVNLVTTELRGLKDMAEMIEHSSKEQKKASEEMQIAINELAKRAELLASNSEDLNEVSDEISGVSGNISEITGRFKVKSPN
ncbi:methyl-accepting chemotaxis protein [Leptospira idonii]|uniref:Methyl-accepting chemotaxis protein n=1 Tax=Leptospira idonii TaxID=1193500 RepID=A0A4R9M251_9LEPT|nr:HAMP domain-containing methyl-accepting chemotaxis protein [Leptospira idonii]TGN19369.1 methyl-accepting chemotaxis protein [Leptospira idonii]